MPLSIFRLTWSWGCHSNPKSPSTGTREQQHTNLPLWSETRKEHTCFESDSERVSPPAPVR